MKTYSARPADISRKWYLIDASAAPLGRISTIVANLLTGKGKPSYTPHIDGGDYVVIINTDNIVMTGNKVNNKMYYRHTGYPGGIKETSAKAQLEKDSTKIVKASIKGMLPANKLREERLSRLKVYKSSEHKHDAQKPEIITLKKEVS